MDIKEKNKKLEQLNYIKDGLNYLIDNYDAVDFNEKYEAFKEYIVKEGMVGPNFHDSEDNKELKRELIKAHII